MSHWPPPVFFVESFPTLLCFHQCPAGQSCSSCSLPAVEIVFMDWQSLAHLWSPLELESCWLPSVLQNWCGLWWEVTYHGRCSCCFICSFLVGSWRLQPPQQGWLLGMFMPQHSSDFCLRLQFCFLSNRNKPFSRTFGDFSGCFLGTWSSCSHWWFSAPCLLFNEVFWSSVLKEPQALLFM